MQLTTNACTATRKNEVPQFQNVRKSIENVCSIKPISRLIKASLSSHPTDHSSIYSQLFLSQNVPDKSSVPHVQIYRQIIYIYIYEQVHLTTPFQILNDDSRIGKVDLHLNPHTPDIPGLRGLRQNAIVRRRNIINDGISQGGTWDNLDILDNLGGGFPAE